MDRLTKKLIDESYEAVEGHSTEELIQKLAKYENMYDALRMEQCKIMLDLEKLRSANKSRTVTFKQLIANKLLVMNIIDRYTIYGL